MMLRVVYMAHMCLPQRILGRVRVKVKIEGCGGQGGVTTVLDRARNVQGTTPHMLILSSHDVTRGVNG